jgi:hypothetical protein
MGTRARRALDATRAWSQRIGERLTRGARNESIPLADAATLSRVAWRTRLLRLALAAVLVALILTAFTSAPDAQTRRFLPSTRVGIVVLDISSSIDPVTYRLIRQVLTELSQTNQRFGLVLFSDQAYEALPPGSPASELKPFIRFFERRPVQHDPYGNPVPRSPWEQTFSGGTAISSGLLLAAELLQRDVVTRGDVVLFSDLVNDQSDYNKLIDVMSLYSERGIPLRIIPLNPPPENKQVFQDLVREKGVITGATLPTGPAGRGELTVEAPFPVWLAVLGGIAILLLLVEALWAEPLAWRHAS